MKKITYIAFGLLLISITSCKDFLDIDDDPNYPAETSSNLLISSGQIGTAAYLGGDLEMVGSFWSQHYTQSNSSNQYNTTVDYDLTYASYTRLWSIPNASALPDLRLAASKAATDKHWNAWVIANVMAAFNYHIITDLYGASTYSQSFQDVDNLTPEFEDGKVVNDSLIALLGRVIAKKADAATSDLTHVIGKQDFVFGGDVDSWIQFAKTLKLKLLMRNFENQKTAIGTLLAENDLLTSDAKIAAYEDKENNSNPLYENDRRKLNTTNNIRACKTLVDYLNNFSDPRVNDFFDPLANDVRAGLRYGDRPTTTVAPLSSHSRATLAATDPVYFISEAESYFLQAEAFARLSDAVKAKELYEKGVTAAFARWGYDASSFIAAGGAYAFDESNLDAMLTSILTQKWVASARCQAWDAYFDINRTGIPALGTLYTTDAGYVWGQLTPGVNSVLQVGEFPRRMLYPKGSSDFNPNTPAVVPITTKMWWHKQ